MLAASCGFGDGFGAPAMTPGGCPAHPTAKPHPSEHVVRLQKALRGLADRVHDAAVYTKPDGLIGKHTVKAVNYAMPKYVQTAPVQYRTGTLTKAQVIKFAPQLAAFVEKGPSYDIIPAKVTSGIYRPPTPAIQTAFAPTTAPPTGAAMPPYYAPPPSYYPPSYAPSYGPPRGPGGLPTDRASVDVKTFIPAQYEHVRFNPATVALVIGFGVIVYAVATKKKSGKD